MAWSRLSSGGEAPKLAQFLGTFVTGEATSNCAFGEDGSTLFITADMYVLRLRLKVKGTGF